MLPFAATGSTASAVRISQVPRVICVSGYVIDSLTQLASHVRPSSEEEAPRLYPPWDEECRNLIRDLNQYPTGGSIEEAPWRTLISNCSASGMIADASYG
jgi:hypothetical protein